jgi:hypothetical protein
VIIGKSIIEICRPNQFVNKFRSYSVYCDGTKIGKIMDGKTKSFKVSSGNHRVLLKIDWVKSNALDVDVTSTCPVRIIATKRIMTGPQQLSVFLLIFLSISLWLLGPIYSIIGIIASSLIVPQILNRPVIKEESDQ